MVAVAVLPGALNIGEQPSRHTILAAVIR